MENYDLLIIGAGAGGLNSAFAAVEKGKKVLLIDKNKPGGECTWFGCIPSKALIQLAKDHQTAQKYCSFTIDTTKIMDKVRDLIEITHQHEAVTVLKDAGIHYINGFAKIISQNEVSINGKKIQAEKIIITTGSRAAVPPIKGIHDVDYLTNETFFARKDLPKTLIVLGGGPIGIELAQAVQRLGTKVILVEMSDRLLIKEEKEVSNELEKILLKEGIELHTSSKAIEVHETEHEISLIIEKDGKMETIIGERLLLASGRKANVEGFGLEELNIELKNGYIAINEKYQTSVQSIFAIGDVVGPYLFSHTAGFQARELIEYLYEKKEPENVSEKNVAWTTFTDPEIARLGLTEEEARTIYKENVKIIMADYNELDRASVDEKTIGFAKIICDKSNYILGATLMGERAAELLGELQIAKQNNIPLTKIKNIIHPYPSYSEMLHALSLKAGSSS
jgi:pyruvate/2-oxoglutarate dehydrogenase complex dihydrolipoamide dehydrogenase (E3) component